MCGLFSFFLSFFLFSPWLMRSFSMVQRYALESGVTTINGKVAKPDTIVRNGDRIENIVHRHEPPVTSKPVKILHEDLERDFIIIDKPGSIVRYTVCFRFLFDAVL
jgi:23S rRNA-/tRNA-specific pseudouridylate synthase